MTIPAPDPLILLRQSIARNTSPILTIGVLTTNTPPSQTITLATATHLSFINPIAVSFPVSISTRFVSGEKSVDLRSIYFAWLHKDSPAEYIPAAQALNEVLGEDAIRNLVFVERLDLITWLEGSSDDSEYIKPLDGAAAQAQIISTSQAVGGTVGGLSGASRTARSGNPILQAIYNNERRVGDRNSVLRGIKPTVCCGSPILTLFLANGWTDGLNRTSLT